jgi:uncharacterized protein (TIGR02001 family)
MRSVKTLALSACALAFFTPVPALAEAPTVEANVALVTDYRFRGVSLSDEAIAVQGGFDLGFDTGVYIGTWASSIEPVGNSETELDFYGGYAWEAGALSFDVGVIGYFYPGADDVAYGEVYGSASGATGAVASTIGIAYAPEQDNIGDDDNLYVYYAGELPLGDSGLTLSGGLGYETGAFGDPDGDGDDKWDWSLAIGGALPVGLDWSLAYIDTSEDTDGSDATAVFTVSKSF